MTLAMPTARPEAAAPDSALACLCADCGRETWLPIRRHAAELARCRRCFRAARSIFNRRDRR